MTWNMSKEELRSVLSLSTDQRYRYFIKRVVDWENIWSLCAKDGWVLAGEDNHCQLVPIWPHARFAQECAIGLWADSEPRSINLSDWLNKWTPGMIRDGRLVAVFPTSTMKGIIVAPDKLKVDLDAERTRYE